MPYAKVFQQGNGFALGVNISPYDEVNVTLYHGKCVNSNYIFCDRIWVFPFFFPESIRAKFFLSGKMKQWKQIATQFQYILRKQNEQHIFHSSNTNL